MNWKQKLSSRKLWAAVAGVVAGLAMVFGLDTEIIGTVSGAVVGLASIVTYIITEGKIDAAAVHMVADVIEGVNEDVLEKAENEGVQ